MNHCWLFNAKTIFMQVNSAISNSTVKQNYSVQISKTVLFQTIQFNLSSLFNSFWPIDSTLSGGTTPGYSGPGSDGNEELLHIPQSSSITGTSPSYCLVSYIGHSLGKSYSSTEMQSVYSTTPSQLDQHASWVIIKKVLWEPYQSHHNGLFSLLLVLRDFAARRQINIGVIRTVRDFLYFLCNSIFLV